MKKFRFLAFMFALTLGFASCSDDDETIVYRPIYSDGMYGVQTVELLGLNGKVKSVEAIHHQSNWNVEDNKVEKGRDFGKTVLEFDNNGVNVGYSYYYKGDNPEAAFELVEKNTCQYDSKYRITLRNIEYKACAEYYDCLAFYYSKTVIIYNDADKKALVSEYTSDDGTSYNLVRKVSYKLNAYGLIDEDNYEELTVRADKRDAPQAEKIKVKGERITISKDGKGNWTEGYQLEKHFDDNGNVIGETTMASDYQVRTISYY